MAGVGHSTLLKFLHTSEITMSEQPTDSPIESQVPLQQLLRTANANTDTSDVRDDKHAENSKKPQIEETKFTTNDLTDKTKEGIDIVPERSLNVSKNDNLSADKYKTPVVDAVRDKENKDILIEYIKSLDKNPEDNLLTFENKEKDEVDTEVAKKNEDITKSENKNDNENSLSNDKTKTSNEDEGTNDNSTEEATAEAVGNVVYSPVITVIKEETTLTKGDLKMQRVVVSEDISDVTMVRKLTTAEQGEPGDAHSVIHSEVLAVAMRTDKQTGDGEQELTKGEHSKDLKKTQTKIPKLRLKQVVERIRKEKEEKLKQEENKIPTGKQLHSSIPKLKDVKTPPQKVDLPKINDINTPLQNNQNNFIENKTSEDVESPRIDDEFDKIYEEIIENETLNNVPSPEKISDPIKLESKFEEIIHAYDENNVQPIVVEKPKSKIPLLKRKSEHDIVIPPPSDRKNLLKRSNTEDFKGKIPVSVSKEILLKPNIETDKSNIDTTKTNVSNTCVHSDVLSTNSDESQSSNTIEVKTITKQMSVETNKVNITASTDNVVMKPVTTNDVSNFETDKTENICTTKINEPNIGIHSDIFSNKNVEKNKTSVKTVTTQTSIEIKKLEPGVSANITKLENFDDVNKTCSRREIAVESLETIANANVSTHKTLDTNSNINSNILSVKNVESLDSFDTSKIKTVTTQTSIEINKVDVIATSKKVVTKSEKTSDNLKDMTKCKIPVALNSKENRATKINSVTINKHPTKVNITENIFNQTTSNKTEEGTDKKVQQSLPHSVTHEIKSATLLLQSDKLYKRESQIPGSPEIDKQIGTKQSYLLQESKTSENTKNVKAIENLIHDMPTIPRTITKYEKETDVAKKDVDVLQNISSPKKSDYNTFKSHSNVSQLKENKDYNVPAPKEIVSTTQSLKKKIDTGSMCVSTKANPIKITDIRVHPTQNENETRYPTSPTSDNINNSKKIINKDTVVIKTKEKEIKAEQKSTNSIVKEPKFSVQYFRNKNETEDKPDDNKFGADINKTDNNDQECKGIQKDNANIQTNNKVKLNPGTTVNDTKPQTVLRTVSNDAKPQTDTRTIIDDKSQTESLYTETKNKWMKIASDSNHRPCDTQTPGTIPATVENMHAKSDFNQKKYNLQSKYKKNNQSLNTPDIPKEIVFSDTKITNNLQTININEANNVQKDLEKEKNIKSIDSSSISTNIEDKEEEDIILLKGKVSRVISRLDSKDHRTVKKEVDDLPTEVSVISKIALFERNELTDTVSKNELNITNSEAATQNLANDKPKVVNEILKTDINQNVVDQPETASVTDIPQNTANNLNSNKANVMETRRVFKTVNSINEGKPLRRTQSSFSAGENYVLAGKEDEPSCLEIWKEYRRQKELELELRRAWSLAELEGEETRGRVRRLAAQLSAGGGRGRSVDRAGGGVPGSVSQRIALYESKLSPSRSVVSRAPPPAAPAPRSTVSVEQPASASTPELQQRLHELRAARAQYGAVNVPRVELSDGARMPVLALGTANLPPELVTAVVSAAIELGYRAVDTAPVYGNEREVGRALRDKIADGTVTRSELFIISKLWSTSHRRDLVEPACRRSLEALGLDYVDLYLIHNPMSFKEGPNPMPKIANVLQYSEHDYLEAWFGIEGLVKKGLVRSAGLSNFNSVQVERVVEKGRIKPVINQVECHPYLSQLRLEEFCAARRVRLSCFGVLGSKGTPGDYTSGLAPAIDDPLVTVLAAGLGVTPAQLLISYQLRLGRTVVVKSSRASHLSQAAAATVAAPLDSATVAALSALNRNKRIFTFKGMGDTHKNYPFRIPF